VIKIESRLRSCCIPQSLDLFHFHVFKKLSMGELTLLCQVWPTSGIRQVGLDQRIQLGSNVALQASMDFLRRQAESVCPTCNARHIVETAAHPTDHVPPRLPGAPVGLEVPKRPAGPACPRAANWSSLPARKSYEKCARQSSCRQKADGLTARPNPQYSGLHD
jgi:hypothetical protein